MILPGTYKSPLKKSFGSRKGLGVGSKTGLVSRAKRAVARRKDRKNRVEKITMREMPFALRSSIESLLYSKLMRTWGATAIGSGTLFIALNARKPFVYNKFVIGMNSAFLLAGLKAMGSKKAVLEDIGRIRKQLRHSENPRFNELAQKYDYCFAVGKRDKRLKRRSKKEGGFLPVRHRFELVFTNEPATLLEKITGKSRIRT